MFTCAEEIWQTNRLSFSSRLGHGEEALETEKDFSRYGRVNYVLGKRLELLATVDKLQNSLQIKDGALAYTCETAGYFFLYHIQSR